MFRSLATAAVLTLGTMTASAANATIFVVDALGNSSSGGTPVATFAVTAGKTINVSVGANDLWSAGALPRWSNADGLTVNRFATGTDESGEAAGTLIGQNFSNYSQGNLSAPYGSLVGEIGGTFFLIGTNYSGPAIGTGTLNLYYWDSNFADNVGSISAGVSVVPEPASWVMLVVGFGLVGFASRRCRLVAA